MRPVPLRALVVVDHAVAAQPIVFAHLGPQGVRPCRCRCARPLLRSRGSSSGTKARRFLIAPKFAMSSNTATRPCNVQNSIVSWLSRGRHRALRPSRPPQRRGPRGEHIEGVEAHQKRGQRRQRAAPERGREPTHGDRALELRHRIDETQVEEEGLRGVAFVSAVTLRKPSSYSASSAPDRRIGLRSTIVSRSVRAAAAGLALVSSEPI